MKIFLTLLGVLLAITLSFSQTLNSYVQVTLTTDTLTNASSIGFLPFSSAYGTFNASLQVDSTGTDDDTSGTADSLAIYFKMLINQGTGTYVNKHDNYLLAEICTISSGAVTWANWVDWTDNAKYLVRFPDLNVCDACSVYFSFGTGDSLITSGILELNFGKAK